MSAPVGSGDVLAGKYRVERVLGEGGMGVVVAARHLQLDQIVALKFLLPEAVANPDALGRFMREARNAARLKSEHVARIIDVGTLDSGAPYIVMEFLEGSDLAFVLARQRALPIPVAVDFILQACDAIAEAHALGIIHRDLKPQNLFVTRRHDNTSLVKVLDFGISKSTAGGGDFAATRTQAVMGSPAYMSPEQMRSAKLVDARTDVWALGIILYQLVLGHVPWEAETFTELCFKVAMDPLPAFPNTGLPAGFEGVVRRCLEKDLNRRFADIYALAVALQPFAPAHAQPLVERIGRVHRSQAGEHAAMATIVAPGTAPGIAPGAWPAPGTASAPGTLPEAAGQRVTRTVTGSRTRKLAGLVAALGVLAGIVVTAVALGGGDGDATDKPASAAAPARAPAPPPVVVPARAPAPPPAEVPPPPPVLPAPAHESPPPPVPPEPAQAGAPPIKVDSPDASTTTRPRDKEPHRPRSTPPAKKPARPTTTPDPLSSPD